MLNLSMLHIILWSKPGKSILTETGTPKTKSPPIAWWAFYVGLHDMEVGMNDFLQLFDLDHGVPDLFTLCR
jgi:hypothetical protein